MQFPELPHPPDDRLAWSANVQTAYQALSSSFTQAERLLGQQDIDPLRFQIQIDIIRRDLLPIVEVMEDNADEENLSLDWIQSISDCLAELLDALTESLSNSRGRENLSVSHVEPVTIVRTGRPGRPRKLINRAYLAEALDPSRNISQPALSSTIGVHTNTIRNYRRIYGIPVSYSRLNNTALDHLMRSFKKKYPDSGIRYAMGYLRGKGLRIQRARVIASLRRIDGIGNVLRGRRHIQRRKYASKRPNYLWHLDGHHKLIRWGIVIHGIIDGYCRTITGIRASNNNRAETVLKLFFDATATHGIPSRVRGDQGGENIEVAIAMVLLRGRNRASFIWGSSTRNTRIERLWVEVGTQFARRWRAFFLRLEQLHHLDIDNPDHIWLLHTLFLPMINEDCQTFQTNWNAHSISGRSTNNRSPNALRFLGMSEHGIYTDDCDGWTPEEIEEYYGVHGPERQRHNDQTGAGHPPDEDANEGDGSEAAGNTQTEAPAVHPAVEVQVVDSPFQNTQIEAAFLAALDVETEELYVPPGYGVLEEEWEDGEYPTIEVIQVGRRRSGELHISLPLDVWLPRAELWARALNLMNAALE